MSMLEDLFDSSVVVAGRVAADLVRSPTPRNQDEPEIGDNPILRRAVKTPPAPESEVKQAVAFGTESPGPGWRDLGNGKWVHSSQPP